MSAPTNNALAIIVPAYKTKFLRETLASIAAQTDKNFQLYVFDDGSPEPIGEIVRELSTQLPLKFHRFENNLGRTSLVQHWERCIRLTDEPWVWLFADDDLMEPGCVADFHAELARTQAAHELYRFNTIWVNSAGARLRECPQHPVEESGAEFLLARLDGRRDVNLQEQIFSRSAWEQNGGIPEFPMGWHSDDAFCACLGVRRPLRLIPGARVIWRASRFNISGDNSYAVVNQKIITSTGYFRWVMRFFQAHAAPLSGEAARCTERWLLNCARTCWQFLDWRACRAVDAVGVEIWGHPRGWGLWLGLRLNSEMLAAKIAAHLGGRKKNPTDARP